MKIKLKVTHVWPETRSCTVNVSTDAFPEGFTWNVEVDLDPIPTGQALVDYLIARSCGNGDQLERKGEIKKALPDMTVVKDLIGKDLSGQVVTTKERASLPKPELEVGRSLIGRVVLDVPQTGVEGL
jgi:hypothetical protein